MGADAALAVGRSPDEHRRLGADGLGWFGTRDRAGSRRDECGHCGARSLGSRLAACSGWCVDAISRRRGPRLEAYANMPAYGRSR
jgi:hypothetical protein